MLERKQNLTIKDILKVNWLLILGVSLVGANLRVPLTSIGALISFVRDDLDISNAVAGSITTLPLLAFALLSPFAPKLSNRIGMEQTIALSLILLIFGIAIRSISGISLIFTGTLFIGLAIAIGNVLIPGIIKIHFPFQIGLITGIYAIFMNVFAAIGSGFSVQIASFANFGWRGAIGIWGILAVITLIIWIPQLNKKQGKFQADVTKEKRITLWGSLLAWHVTIFMGSQSFIYYTNITWLPDILLANGYSPNKAGWILFLLLFVFIPFTFIIPVIAERLRNQIGLSIVIAALLIIGYIGLLIGPTALIPLWIILIGAANGSSFGLAMMFFTLRTADGRDAAELSGMAQSIGYLLAAIGPVIVGAIYDKTNGWTIPILLLVFMSVLVMINGIAAGKDSKIVTTEKLFT